MLKRSALFTAVVAATLSGCGGSDQTTAAPPAAAAHAYAWSLGSEAAEFAGRDGAGAVTFNGKAWLLGGWRWAGAGGTNFPQTGTPGCCTTSEVWSSADGVTWSFETIAPWAGRHMAGWAVFNGRMWVVGGDNNKGYYETDVWSSVDGVTWEQVATDVPWAPRVLHYVVAFNGKLYIMGGQQVPAALVPIPSPYPAAPVYYSDVWSSPDGVTWEQVGSMPRALGMICGTVVFNDQLWVIGGGTYGDDTQSVGGVTYNEVWSTSDGVTWTQHADAPWPARRYHNAVVFDGKLWVLAGIGDDGSPDKNDVWYSADGETWTELPSTPWGERHAATAFVFNSALWITGGTDNGQLQHNDVWRLQVQP
jgi:hypothetical protein